MINRAILGLRLGLVLGLSGTIPQRKQLIVLKFVD